MEPEVDAPLIVASMLIMGLLLTSAVLWYRSLRQAHRRQAPEPGISGWPIGWVNFGIFLCASVIAVFLVQNVVGFLLLPNRDAADGPMEFTPWLAVLAVTSLHFPLLAVFWGARRFFPHYYAGRLSDVALSPGTAFFQTVPIFIRWLPIVWLCAFVWTAFLSLLEGAGLVDELAPQELVTLFQSGGDPLAIILLVLCAVVLAPIVEELVFRGALYRFLKTQVALIPAQLVSATLFALMHGNLFSLGPLICVGVCLARIYEKTGSIVAAIWFHAFFNAFSLAILFISNLSDTIPQ